MRVAAGAHALGQIAIQTKDGWTSSGGRGGGVRCRRLRLLLLCVRQVAHGKPRGSVGTDGGRERSQARSGEDTQPVKASHKGGGRSLGQTTAADSPTAAKLEPLATAILSHPRVALVAFGNARVAVEPRFDLTRLLKEGRQRSIALAKRRRERIVGF